MAVPAHFLIPSGTFCRFSPKQPLKMAISAHSPIPSGKYPYLYLPTGHRMIFCPLPGHRMNGSAHLGILWPQNTCFCEKIGHRMKNTASVIILWQENESGELFFGRGGAADLAKWMRNCGTGEKEAELRTWRKEGGAGEREAELRNWRKGGGAAELEERSRRQQRSFLPSRLRGALWKALLACLRKTSCTVAHPAEVERSLSPVQNSELGLTARFFRPRINSRWEPGGRPSQGRKWRRRFSPASKASSVDGSLYPARKTSAQHSQLATKQASFVAR